MPVKPPFGEAPPLIQNRHLRAHNPQSHSCHDQQRERVPVRKLPLLNDNLLLLQNLLPQQPGQARAVREADSANVAGHRQRNRRGPITVVGEVGCPDDLREKDRGADVGARDVAEDNAKHTDEPDDREHLAVRGPDEPVCEYFDPALVSESFDEDELGECEGDEGEREAGERCEEGREMCCDLVVLRDIRGE